MWISSITFVIGGSKLVGVKYARRGYTDPSTRRVELLEVFSLIEGVSAGKNPKMNDAMFEEFERRVDSTLRKG